MLRVVDVRPSIAWTTRHTFRVFVRKLRVCAKSWKLSRFARWITFCASRVASR